MKRVQFLGAMLGAFLAVMVVQVAPVVAQAVAPPASGTGITSGAQTFSGTKTFANGVVTPAVSYTTGGNSGDVAVKVGTSATANDNAKMLQITSQAGGSEVSEMNFYPNGVMTHGGGAVRLNDNVDGARLAYGSSSFFQATAQQVSMSATTTARVYSFAGGTAGDFAAQVGFTNVDANVNATARPLSIGTGVASTYSEKAFFIKDGTLEFTGPGVGIVLAAPNGTRYKVTVNNAGVVLATAL